MYEVGDIVSLPTGELFAFYFEERETLEYTVRDTIYGVVTNANLSYDLHHVRWAIEGMFNLPQVEWEVLNDQMFFTEELTLVREKNDPEISDDLYIAMFFLHTPTGWRYNYTIPPCSISNCNGNCFRTVREYRMPMIHLFMDLHSQSNDELTNREKRYVSYRWFTKIRHGNLRAGDRRRICPCVEAEIGILFPRLPGEERVGFRS